MLRLERVDFAYPGRSRSLRRIELSIGGGDVVVVTGPSGAGKSTLARLATGLLRPTAGRVTLDGRPLRLRYGRPSPVHLVFQDPVDAFNPRRTLERSLAETGAGRESVLRALEVVELDPLLLAERPGRLSGGELQRMGVARALLADARALVVDEPLAQLDPATALTVLDALAAAHAARGCALLVLSHAADWYASLGGRRYELAGGRLIERG